MPPVGILNLVRHSKKNRPTNKEQELLNADYNLNFGQYRLPETQHNASGSISNSVLRNLIKPCTVMQMWVSIPTAAHVILGQSYLIG